MPVSRYHTKTTPEELYLQALENRVKIGNLKCLCQEMEPQIAF